MSRARLIPTLVSLGALVCTMPAAHAQTAPTLGYADPGSGDDSVSTADAPLRGGQAAGRAQKRTKIVPYLEVDQSVYDEITPHSQVLTYTTLAAGVDATINSHRTTGVATLRYEHHFVETGGVGGSDTFTGLLRTTTQIVPRTLSLDFGGIAQRTSIGPAGGVLINPVDNVGSIYQLWSLYGGPSLSTHAGVVGIKGSYNLGYTEIDQLHSFVPAAGGAPVDRFGHSLSQQGALSAGVRPGEVLPFGFAVLGSYLREDISTLDQRLIDERVVAQATQPVSRTAAIVGEVGWEKVQVAQRDALRDANGNPVIAPNGLYVTNTAAPRQIAYQTTGLTWDVGVVWRPSRRTTAAAYVGQRYDSTTYYGTLVHAPSSRQTLSVSVFDGIYGFGSGLLNALEGLPTDASVSRDPFSGNLGGCFLGGSGGTCVTGALGSANAAVFRARGVNAAWGYTRGHIHYSLGGGYIARRFITAAGSVLAAENGALDQTWFVDGGISGPIDRKTQFFVNGFASVYRTDAYVQGGTADWGVNGQVIRHITDHLVGTASVELLGINPQISPDTLEALGQVGLRYNFR